MILRMPNGSEIDIKRIVVKLGTKQITDINSINRQNISNIVKDIVDLRNKGVDVVITASGAIGLGVHKLFGKKEKLLELNLPQKQAIAGVGQVELMGLLKEEFSKYKISVGQVLLTYAIIENRSAYQNAGNTLNTMLDMGIVPVINENDSVAVEEIKVGDNDRLGAFVSQLVDADLYIMLSDIDGFYMNYGKPEQKFLKSVDNVRDIENYAKKQEENFTKGGMITKLQAVQTNSVNGIHTVIANGFKENILTRVMDGISEGTVFIPAKNKLNLKKKWITGRKASGSIVVDDGAAEALKKHKSLLASGIRDVKGVFKTNDKISITDLAGTEIAVGLVNYSSEQVKKIAGKKSAEVETMLGKDYAANSIVHIDNMVIYEK